MVKRKMVAGLLKKNVSSENGKYHEGAKSRRRQAQKPRAQRGKKMSERGPKLKGGNTGSRKTFGVGEKTQGEVFHGRGAPGWHSPQKGEERKKRKRH